MKIFVEIVHSYTILNEYLAKAAQNWSHDNSEWVKLSHFRWKFELIESNMPKERENSEDSETRCCLILLMKILITLWVSNYILHRGEYKIGTESALRLVSIERKTE